MWGAWGNCAGGALNTEYSASWPLTGPDAKIARKNTTGVCWCHQRRSGRQRWTIGVPADEGGGREPNKGVS